MKPRQKPGAEQFMLTLRQIEVGTTQGKSIYVACRKADVSEQSFVTNVCVKRSYTRRRKRGCRSIFRHPPKSV
ncbi:hypothetical protein FOHLNKBM_6321 [Methylobacterium longum]|nr:hypothetical protein FOHLNKBM_6321 [Methylobacterium longum]